MLAGPGIVSGVCVRYRLGMEKDALIEELVVALDRYCRAAPGGFAMLGRVQAKSPVWEVVDDDDLILGALKMAGASGDPRFGPLLIQLISRIFADLTRMINTTPPGWDTMTRRQQSHAGLAGATEIFEMLGEQIAAVDALGELGADDEVPHLLALARHPEVHPALVGAIKRNLKRLADRGSAGAREALASLKIPETTDSAAMAAADRVGVDSPETSETETTDSAVMAAETDSAETAEPAETEESSRSGDST